MQYAEREEAYIGKVTRRLAMARAVDDARRGIKLGDWLTVKEYPTNPFSAKRTISGRVCYVNEHYFTIQTKHYREAFSFINVALGQVEIV